METVAVRAPSRVYEVRIGTGALDGLRSLVDRRFERSRLFAICDENTRKLFAERLEEAAGRPLALLSFAAGEASKNLNTAGRLYESLLQLGAARRDAILALGGGVVGDIAGFVAATYFRGIEYIQVPTTLLAMVDSAIGGKVGVDLPGAKNAVGAFWQPSAVLADLSCLESLPEEEYLAGMSEVLKYALVFDPEMASSLEEGADRVGCREGTLMERLIARCVELKARVVEEDERDRGSRMLLNYGHTFAHGLEAATSYTGINHGQAVAAGMLMAARFSELIGLGEPGLESGHRRLEEKLGLIRELGGFDVDAIISAMQSDKKREGALRLVLLKKPGDTVIVAGPEEDDLRRAVSEILRGGEGK